jgi:hypothetical protein
LKSGLTAVIIVFMPTVAIRSLGSTRRSLVGDLSAPSTSGSATSVPVAPVMQGYFFARRYVDLVRSASALCR